MSELDIVLLHSQNASQGQVFCTSLGNTQSVRQTLGHPN